MPYEVKSKPYWGLNLVILLLIGVLLAVILIPKQIWEEEESYRTESRTHMQNLWKVEDMFFDLTGSYTELGSNAIQLVNSVYDSLVDTVAFHGNQTLELPPEKATLNIDAQTRDTISFVYDSTLADTVWTAQRQRLIDLYNRLTVNDSTNSGQWANMVLRAAYDSIAADTGWVGQRVVTIPFTYDLEVSPNYVKTYDTTFVTKLRSQETVQDTSYHMVIQISGTEDTTITEMDTTWVPARDKQDFLSRYPELTIIDTSVTRQTKWITETRPNRPREEWLNDPLTGKKYLFQMSADGLHLRIESPIEGTYEEPRYYVFSLSDTSHGYIQDGDPSWEQQQSQ